MAIEHADSRTQPASSADVEAYAELAAQHAAADLRLRFDDGPRTINVTGVAVQGQMLATELVISLELDGGLPLIVCYRIFRGRAQLEDRDLDDPDGVASEVGVWIDEGLSGWLFREAKRDDTGTCRWPPATEGK